MITRKNAKRVLIVLFSLMALSMLLPIYKGEWVEGETGTLIMRGFNFLETNLVAGCLIVAAIFASIVTLTTNIGFRKKCIILFPINLINIFALIVSNVSAGRYMYEVDIVNVTGEFGLYVLIALSILGLILPFILEVCSRPINTYSDAEELCNSFVECGLSLEREDAIGYRKFCHMLFWANEYAKQKVLENLPDHKEYAETHNNSGATMKDTGHLEVSKITFLSDYDSIIKEHMPIKGMDVKLPNDEAKLRFACYLSLYLSLY